MYPIRSIEQAQPYTLYPIQSYTYSHHINNNEIVVKINSDIKTNCSQCVINKSEHIILISQLAFIQNRKVIHSIRCDNCAAHRTGFTIIYK